MTEVGSGARNERLPQERRSPFWLFVSIVGLWLFVFAAAYNQPVLQKNTQQYWTREANVDKPTANAPEPNVIAISENQSSNDHLGEAPSQGERTKDSSGKAWWGKLIDFSIADLLLTIFTAAITGFTWQQIRLNRLLQRAYLAVEPQGVRMLNLPRDRAIASVGVRNVGRMQAHDVSWVIHQQFSPHWRLGDQSDHFQIDPTKIEGRNVVPPGTAMIQGGEHFEAAQLASSPRDIYIYVWGAVFYSDGLSNGIRTTRFCHRYNCVNFRGSRIRPEMGRYHRHGNDAD